MIETVNRRKLIVGLGIGALAGPLAGRAQPASKVARIGWLEPGTAAASAARIAGFKQGLSDLGRNEGRDFTIEFRFAQGKLDLFPPYAEELVRLRPECVFAVGIDAVRALMRASSTLPIVMGTIDADPVKEGIVKSLARPGGNVTGMMGIAWEIAAKRIEILLEVVPAAKRVAILMDPRSRAGHAHLEGTQAAAKRFGIELQVLEARQADDLPPAFPAMREARTQALSLISIGLMNTHRSPVLSG